MKAKWLINPFERIAGWQALVIGIIVMVLIAVIGKLNHVFFVGVLNVNPFTKMGFSTAFIMQVVDFLVLFFTMWLAGICFSKTKLRVVDVAGTMALARVPMLLFLIICFLPIIPASPYDISRLIIFTLISIPFFIWMIALIYNAYTVSCHLKGSRAVLSFIGALLVGEIVSICIFIFLLSGMFANSPATCASKTTSTENTTVVIDSLTIRQKTEKVITAFEQGDMEAVTVYFDPTMKKALPPSGLKMAWLQVNMTYGKFEKTNLDSLKESQMNKYDLIEVPFFFQKGNINLRLTFNKDGTIGGLFFLPEK